ncbi:MAG: hypothetical protein ACTH32_06440 [Microbacterium gubbeenense]|uniref:hypothetical protein n=1 Tax=Microbacterium gubbeenense TaxID=159896 RepID=UPI003F9C5CED
MDDERLSALKEAKARIGVPYKIVPVRAVPGSPGRILCWGRPAPFYTESVVIAAENALNVESVTNALRFLLEAPAGAQGSVTEEDWMEAVVGCPVALVQELSAADLEDERVEREINAVRFP